MKLITSNTYELSTGRQFYANGGIIGIDEELNITEGYDGGISTSVDAPWTRAERDELADFMIARWQVFKALPAEPES